MLLWLYNLPMPPAGGTAAAVGATPQRMLVGLGV